MSPDKPPSRRYRLISDLSLFELGPLLGDGATVADLRRLADRMGRSFALERLDDDVWKVVGITSGEETARAWLETDIDPEPPSDT